MKRLLVKIFSLLVAVIMAFSGTVIISAAEPMFGYDVSELGENPNAYGSSENFVMIRLCGFTYLDGRFWENVKKAYNAKMNFGIYVSTLAENDEQAQLEAEKAISLISQLGDYAEYFTLPVAYNFLEYQEYLNDYTMAENTERMTTFCDIISDAGYTPMVYADSDWITNRLDSSVIQSKGYKLWYSETQSNPDFTTNVKAGDTDLTVDMWQYSRSVSGKINENVIYTPNTLIKSLDCLHSYTSTVTKDASIGADGEETHVCSKCGKSYSTVVHYYINRISSPTCTSDGLSVKECANCHLISSSDIIPATGHSYVDDNIEPTCTKNGLERQKCTKCNDIIEGNVLKATGHSYVDYKIEATCTEEGRERRRCKNCGDIIIGDIIPPKGHNYQDYYLAPTCTQKGINGKKCTVCGDIIVDEEIPLKSHSYKSTTTKATTSKDGKIVKSCTECGEVALTTVIYKASSIKLEASTLTYNGKVRTPRVYVKDSKGKTISSSNYTVTYAGGLKNVGKYAVKVTFKGNYSGTKTLYFTIKPKATSISSLSAGSKKFTVKWKKQSTQVTGYQIQYSTSSKFTSPKTVTVSSYKTTSKTISKLKGKKKYYVRVRTYKTVGKTKYYSSWSGAKSTTTKK